MARWKLMTPHYLNVEGCKWEYHEVSRTTGKAIRTQIPVPTHLDPRDPADFTHKWGQQAQPGVHTDIEGEIIVSRGPSIDSRDIIFSGNPTPDMMPIDDEARAISAEFTERWKYKPDVDTSSGNFSQSMIDRFQVEMADIATRPARIEGMNELLAAMTAMIQSNQELIKASPARRGL